MSHLLADYDFDLPPEMIAQTPCDPAHNSRLLMYTMQSDHQQESIIDTQYHQIPSLINPQSLVIANSSQTIHGRIIINNTTVNHPTQGLIQRKHGELLIVKIIIEDGVIDQQHCIMRCSDTTHAKPGSTIMLRSDHHLVSQKFVAGGILMEIKGLTLESLCKQYGTAPLPRYITQNHKSDEKKYLTSFGTHPGSVATPTAGLHFTDILRNEMQTAGIHRETIMLHVGIGTFTPVITSTITDHTMHAEYASIDKKIFMTIAHRSQTDIPCIAIGTTSTRVLESLPFLYPLLSDSIKQTLDPSTRARRESTSQQAQQQPSQPTIIIHHIQDSRIDFSTDCFIYPGRKPLVIDGLCTNFHLPKTSLTMLVAGIVGYEARKKIYDHAKKQSYRRASFGDGMCIILPPKSERKPNRNH